MRLLCPHLNSRARGGRDAKKFPFPILQHVSIHAPAWGATKAAFFVDMICQSFNSRARGGRDSMGFYLPIFICLQRFFCETFLFSYFYIHFRTVIFRNLLTINMCECYGFFCALGVRLLMFALLFYHRLQIR